MDINVNYIRTLIIGVHFDEHSGAGTFLGRLFSAWPIDRLATVDGSPLIPSWRRCRRHYRIRELRFPLNLLSRWLLSAKWQGPLAPTALIAGSSCPVTVLPKMSFIRRLVRYPWPAIRRLTGGGELFFRVAPSAQLLSWVHEFQAEVIYGQCSSLGGVRFLRRMQQSLGLPLVLHFMDDWAETSYRDGWSAKLLRPRFEREFRELVQSADVAIAICKEMAAEYEKRYQRPVFWLPMPVEVMAYQNATRTEWAAGRTFHIRYGGRVGWAIRESLADLARVVHSLRQEEETDVVFDIVTSEPQSLPADCLSLPGVNVQSPGPLVDLPHLQAEADVLVICYDFDITSFAQARYSMPAKMADCMASGTPILVYAPAGLPVVEYARRDGWGKVVDTRDTVALRSALCELMDSESLREQLGRTAKRLAAERHDANFVSERFREMLEKAKKSRKRKTESR